MLILRSSGIVQVKKYMDGTFKVTEFVYGGKRCVENNIIQSEEEFISMCCIRCDLVKIVKKRQYVYPGCRL